MILRCLIDGRILSVPLQCRTPSYSVLWVALRDVVICDTGWRALALFEVYLIRLFEFNRGKCQYALFIPVSWVIYGVLENITSLRCSIASFASYLFISDLWVPKCQTISDYCWIRGSACNMRVRGWRIFIEFVDYRIVRITECCSCWNTVYVGCVLLFVFLSCRQPFDVWCLLTYGTDNHRCRWVNKGEGRRRPWLGLSWLSDGLIISEDFLTP